MFEKNVDKFILTDALKISLADYLKKNIKPTKVKKGLKGEIGKCIKNSLEYDKDKIAIGFCVFEGEQLINTIDIIIHAINYNGENYIDNTNVKGYTFYLIDKYINLNEENLRNEMFKISKKYKKLAIENLEVLYKDIRLGNFMFEIEEE
jgi:septum formation topological specificity factor MinE